MHNVPYRKIGTRTMLLERRHPVLKMNRRVLLQDLNPHLMCVLCGGYYVDATTIIECVHSFCRSCIVKHLESSKYCPICEVMVHKTKPLMNIRRDEILQDMVYKLVPGLFAREMKQRRQFYIDRPHYVKPDDFESGGDVSDERKAYICDDSIMIALSDNSNDRPPWYLKCPIGVTIEHIKKLVLSKYGFRASKVYVEVRLKNTNQLLDDDLTLLDISCLYPWRSKHTFSLIYSMFSIDDHKKVTASEEKKETVVVEKSEDSKEIVEKEIQLEITEAGVMKVCEVSPRIADGTINQLLGSGSGDNKVQVSAETKPEIKVKPITMPPLERPVKRPSVDSDHNGVVSKKPKLAKEPFSNVKKVDSMSPKIEDIKMQRHEEVAVKIEVKPKAPESIREISSEFLTHIPKTSVSQPPNLSDLRPATYSLAPSGNFTHMPSPSKQPAPVNHVKPQPVAPTNSTEDKKSKPKPSGSLCHPWRPVITKEKLRPTLMSNSEEAKRPGKFFKMRNMPRFLGNPSSGVKPMYSNGVEESSPTPESTASTPIVAKNPDIIRIDPKTLRPMQKEEKKAPNPLITSPYIPRDNHFHLPDPKTQPYGLNLPLGFHASLPPSVSLLMNPHQHFRNLKAKLCDTPENRPSASSSKPTTTQGDNSSSSSPSHNNASSPSRNNTSSPSSNNTSSPSHNNTLVPPTIPTKPSTESFGSNSPLPTSTPLKESPTKCT